MIATAVALICAIGPLSPAMAGEGGKGGKEEAAVPEARRPKKVVAYIDDINAKLEWITKDHIETKIAVQQYLNYLYEFAHFDTFALISTNRAVKIGTYISTNGMEKPLNFNMRGMTYVPYKQMWLGSSAAGGDANSLLRCKRGETTWRQLNAYPGVKTKPGSDNHPRSEARNNNAYIRRLVFDPVHNMVIALNRADGPWYSKDCGDTWKHLGKTGTIDNIDLYSAAVGVNGTIMVSSSQNIWRFDATNDLDNAEWEEIKPDPARDLDFRAIAAGTTITSYKLGWDDSVYHFPVVPRDAKTAVKRSDPESEISQRSMFVVGVSRSHVDETGIYSVFVSLDDGKTFNQCPGMNKRGMCAFRGFTFKNGVFVGTKFVSGNGEAYKSANSTGIWYSHDGINWQRAEVPELDAAIQASHRSLLYEPAYSHGTFIAPAIGGDSVYCSNNGVDWVKMSCAGSNAYILADGDGEIYHSGSNGLWKHDIVREIVSPYIYSKREIDEMFNELKEQIW